MKFQFTLLELEDALIKISLIDGQHSFNWLYFNLTWTEFQCTAWKSFSRHHTRWNWEVTEASIPGLSISTLCFPSLLRVLLGNQSSCVRLMQPVFLWRSRCLFSLDKQRSWRIPDLRKADAGWHHGDDIIIPWGKTRPSPAFDPNHNSDHCLLGVSPCLPQFLR